MTRSSTLSDTDLKKFCAKEGLSFHLIDLSQLSDSSPKNCFIHTGTAPNEYNHSYINHWLFLHGNYLFDSYGKQRDYKLPDFIKPVVTYPHQLQSYNTNVCGEYCCAFYKYLHSSPDYENLGAQFSREFQFSSNKTLNDKKINNWFNEIMH